MTTAENFDDALDDRLLGLARISTQLLRPWVS
jgi:hypothetical protein